MPASSDKCSRSWQIFGFTHTNWEIKSALAILILVGVQTESHQVTKGIKPPTSNSFIVYCWKDNWLGNQLIFIQVVNDHLLSRSIIKQVNGMWSGNITRNTLENYNLCEIDVHVRFSLQHGCMGCSVQSPLSLPILWLGVCGAFQTSTPCVKGCQIQWQWPIKLMRSLLKCTRDRIQSAKEGRSFKLFALCRTQ